MLIAFLAAFAIVLGARPVAVLAIGSAWLHPIACAVFCAIWLARAMLRGSGARRGRGSGGTLAEEEAFLHGTAAELRGGASLRGALAAAAARSPALDTGDLVRKAMAGVGIDEVAGEVTRSLPANGRHAGAAVRIAATTGATAAAAFESLALVAAEQGDLVRERSALTAQARLSALVVGGAPLALAALLILLGQDGLLSGGGVAGVILAGVGVVLEVIGLLVVWWMVRSAER